jgi:stage II sporulation protein D
LRETEGIVLTYRGSIIPAYYHASCGGRTESALHLWGIDAPYLRGVDCECQEISRYGLWEKRISSDIVAGALKRLGYRVSGISTIDIDGITPAGRVRRVAIGHAGGITSVPAEKFRAAVGYAAIPSIFFETEVAGDEIVVSGRGLGHGVGLCQWGAKEMAQRGLGHRAILQHYYPGTRLQERGTLNP